MSLDTNQPGSLYIRPIFISLYLSGPQETSIVCLHVIVSATRAQEIQARVFRGDGLPTRPSETSLTPLGPLDLMLTSTFPERYACVTCHHKPSIRLLDVLGPTALYFWRSDRFDLLIYFNPPCGRRRGCPPATYLLVVKSLGWHQGPASDWAWQDPHPQNVPHSCHGTRLSGWGTKPPSHLSTNASGHLPDPPPPRF